MYTQAGAINIHSKTIVGGLKHIQICNMYFASIVHAALGAKTARMFGFGSVIVMGNKMRPRKIQEMKSTALNAEQGES